MSKKKPEKGRRRYASLRAQLEAEGAPEALIVKALEQERWSDLVARYGQAQARRIVNLETHGCDLDDRGFRFSFPDSLLTGAGRVDGIAAKVVRRRETITRFQYRQMVDKDGAA